MKPEMRGLLCCTAAAALLIGASAAHAQDAAAADKDELPQGSVVVVTAAPVARGNMIVDTERLREQGAALNVVNAIADVPGVSIRGSDAYNSDPWSYGINIRGFDVNLRSSKIGQTIDDMPAYNASYYLGGAPAQKYLQSELIGSIRVDQGTSSVSSASASALGGTIAYYTRDPGEETGGLLSMSIGDYGLRRYAGYIDTGRFLNGSTRAYIGMARLTSCRWAYGCADQSGSDEWHAEGKFVSELGRLTLTGRVSWDKAVDDPLIEASRKFLDTTNAPDGSVPNWTGTTPAGVNENWAHVWSAHRENLFGYVKARYQASDALSFEIAPYYHRQKGQGDWAPPYQQIALDPNGVRTIAGGTAPGSSRKKAYYAWTDASGRQRPVVQGLDYTDIDGTRILSSYCYGAGGAVNTACVPTQTYRTSLYGHDRFGFTSKVTLDTGRNRIEAGLWYERLNRNFGRWWRQIADIRKGPAYYTDPQLIDFMQHFTTNQWKLHAEDSLELGRLTVTAGVQKYWIDISGETEGWDAFGKSVAPLRTRLNADSDPLFSLGAVYDFGNGLQAFAGFSQNYGAVGDWALEKTQTDTSKLQSSVANDYEAGLRFGNRRVSATLTGYYIDYRHAISFYSADFVSGGPSGSASGINYTAGTSGAYANSGKGIASRGVEAAAAYRVTPHFDLNAAFTWNRSTYQEAFLGGTANAGTDVQVAKGNKVPGAPTTLVSLGADYHDDALRAGVRFKHTGRTPGDAVNSPANYLPAYNIVDVSAGYRFALDGKRYLDAQINVTNLFEEHYIGGMLDEFTQLYTRGAPRTVSATLSVGF
ncbi:TonB-dependent receptor [Sphingobium sp. EM0848]|uniref:TonB-dependent receptor n=1 Tax=Sphingobium sp. EM0848 TaxID=2743473 RepID=UPI00159BFCB2|nr:TonB-dependent receptor [Sphingobium sp. EM0848]